MMMESNKSLNPYNENGSKIKSANLKPLNVYDNINCSNILVDGDSSIIHDPNSKIID